ncbi:hypothetical protein SESBI_19914 [Sesbania bispinosa]|nr:hypothetical protein SESBI_19914 [Sesbania bispinosa]
MGSSLFTPLKTSQVTNDIIVVLKLLQPSLTRWSKDRKAVKGNPQVQPAPEMEPRRGRFTAARREFLTAENGTPTRTDRDSGRDVTEAPHRADRGGWGTQSLCDCGLPVVKCQSPEPGNTTHVRG